jgi:hypothetical protein
VTKDTTIDDPLSEEMFLELAAIEKQLLAVQDKLKALPGWRASKGVEFIEKTLDDYGFGLFDLSEYPHRPANFSHWSEKIVNAAPWHQA